VNPRDVSQQPAPQQPAPWEPAPQQPAPWEPAPREPAPQQSAPREPAPQEPAPQEPAPWESAPREPARSVLQTLLEEPARFSFDAALAVIIHAAGSGRLDEAVSFRALAGLGYVASDLAAVERSGTTFRVTTGLLGLTGPSGVLPRPYTDIANTEYRRRAPAMGAFFDLLAQRPLTQFASAGIKYQPHRAAQAAAIGHSSPRPPADGLRRILLALTGYGTPHLAPRLDAGVEPLLFYAGLFAPRVRSADRLRAIVSDWLGQPVAVEQFAGAWLSLAPEEMSALPAPNRPGQFNRLGVDAAIGSRSWDMQSRIVLHVGPLTLQRFNAMLPDGSLFRRLASLVRAYLDCEIGFAINPVLAAAEVPPIGLSGTSAVRLGWNAWLPTCGRRPNDAAEAVFEADDVQAPVAAPLAAPLAAPVAAPLAAPWATVSPDRSPGMRQP
jgi:type VI secretion system protein ImpH